MLEETQSKSKPVEDQRPPLEIALEKKEAKISQLKRKLKTANQKIRRNAAKIKSMKELITELRDKKLIEPNCQDVLDKLFSGVPLEMMTRMVKKKGKGAKYSATLKCFATTLQFYSAKAYEYVRKTFGKSLPSQRQVRRWYSKIQADPGFTESSFVSLSQKVKDNDDQNHPTLVALQLDEMAIKKYLSWDGVKFRGYVDIGNDADPDDDSPMAKDALVFMAVSVNGYWKVPIAYFLIDGLNASERANLVKIAIKKLSDIKITVTALTCDGPTVNRAMMTNLGINTFHFINVWVAQ